MFSHNIRTKLPQVKARTATLKADILQRDQQQKQTIKAYADKRRHATPSNIKARDQVLLQQARRDKLTSAFDPKPYTVISHKGTSLVLQRRGGPQIMRNVSATRKLLFPPDNVHDFESDDDGMKDHAPQVLWERTLKIAHKGHQGIVKTNTTPQNKSVVARNQPWCQQPCFQKSTMLQYLQDKQKHHAANIQKHQVMAAKKRLKCHVRYLNGFPEIKWAK